MESKNEIEEKEVRLDGALILTDFKPLAILTHCFCYKLQSKSYKF